MNTRRLAQIWGQSVPAATVATVQLPDDLEADAASVLLARRLAWTGSVAESLVLAGVCGAEGTALQIAFAPDAPAWAGVLICGAALPSLKPLADAPARLSARLRLVWEAPDPLGHAAALAELLRWYRAAGLDAQGSVLGGQKAADGPSPTLVRLGGAYLAELVAVALSTRHHQPARVRAAAPAA